MWQASLCSFFCTYQIYAMPCSPDCHDLFHNQWNFSGTPAICRYKQNKPTSTFSVDHNSEFTSYAWLLLLLFKLSYLIILYSSVVYGTI